MNPAQQKTSISHPLYISEVPANEAGGLIGITFCPGKCGPAVAGHYWMRNLAIDLDVIADWKASHVVTLIENHEFEFLKVKGLESGVRERSMTWHHLPIEDVRPPDAVFEGLWQKHGPELLRTLKSGGRVLVHCRGGLGRAGTVAARLLIELGTDPEEAVVRVRSARPGAIETKAQLQYLMKLPVLHPEGV